ncbi:hypothetical protein [Pseudactinotalea sp. HY158]|uniref:hypothetical protein n=1 Tax=Pseudactinotalea sp. HY158 TaxID=2654547 RepID=UPI00129CDE12|nr:hypothetical protein [Pseudactinotalea sp. HY158]QGH70780.1 hypothetical protein GCE65_15710 [Pseudactinotalea sp. HY158]
MLSRILAATGHRIHGETVVSAGDPAAIEAARPLLEALLDSRPGALATALSAEHAASVDFGWSDTSRTIPGSTGLVPPVLGTGSPAAAPWRARWVRAGWLSETADIDAMVLLAVSAGNAAKIARRTVARRTVVADGGWRPLTARLGEAGIDYAVSGLIAARADRASAAAVNPVIYVADPARAASELGLHEARPGDGVLLIAAQNGELDRAEADGGVRFVTQAQGMLDAFAGSGREPDKAESILRQLLAARA